MRILAANGADLHLADGERVTPLQHARRRGFRAIEQVLLQAGARR